VVGRGAENDSRAREVPPAGLRYRFDDTPGISRQRGRTAFRYVDPSGKRITDGRELRRIKRLAIPPAWAKVWISPQPNTHILATGRDQRGRKQYRYHPTWRAVRDDDKFDRLIAFAEALPRIRRRTARDLRKPGLPREKVLATIVRLLEVSLIRIGNDEYVRANGSFGLTTLRNRHVEISGASLTFDFRGKSGKRHRIKVADRGLARIVKNCRDLPGYELFQYVDDAGVRHPIESGDVNAYLQDAAGSGFSAKDFRTWAGTVLAATALQEMPPFASQTAARHSMKSAIDTVAARLGNTAAICRKCYIHPAVFDAFLDQTLVETLQRHAGQSRRSRATCRLGRQEAAVLGLLRTRLARSLRPTESADLTETLRRAATLTAKRRNGAAGSPAESSPQ
jgi:DNA topoisomerase-1